jgi:hypothetical protein
MQPPWQRRGSVAAPSARQHPAAPPGEGSSQDAADRLADAERRNMANACKYRQDPLVMEHIDVVLESVPPCSATYVLRLLTHATDPDQVPS